MRGGGGERGWGPYLKIETVEEGGARGWGP